MQRILFYIFLFLGLIILPDSVQADSDLSEKEGLDVGETIMDHVLDSHQWHIVSTARFHVIIPLPVIVYSEQSGWHCFLSNKILNKENQSFRGFSIPGDGPYKGKLIESSPDGTITRPADLSITKNVLAIFISMGLMLWMFISSARRYGKNPKSAPAGLQNLLEIFILFVQDNIARPSLGEKRYRAYLPWLLTVFFFILINNFLGIIPFFPGGANLTGNITITLFLALITFFVTQFSGNRHYWLDIFNAPGVPWYLKVPVPLLPFVELLGVFIKPFVLTLRLFANITAGHIIVLGFMMMIIIFGEKNPWAGFGVSPVSVIFSIFMNMLEILVAFIQAYVFTLLSALYVGFATAEPHGKKAV